MTAETAQKQLRAVYSYICGDCGVHCDECEKKNPELFRVCSGLVDAEIYLVRQQEKKKKEKEKGGK